MPKTREESRTLKFSPQNLKFSRAFVSATRILEREQAVRERVRVLHERISKMTKQAATLELEAKALGNRGYHQMNKAHALALAQKAHEEATSPGEAH